jgi:tryptophan-rich sensory protein
MLSVGAPKGQQWGWLATFLAAVFGVAYVGGRATAESVGSWYRTLNRPVWNPPNQVFGPVWTTLYAQMALAAWLVRRDSARDPSRRARGTAALAAWAVQLTLNLVWSRVFFGRRSPGGGVAVIVPLWASIAATLVLVARVTRLGALLLAPYLAWTTFAVALNLRIWQLNRR